MTELKIIIPSKNADNLSACVGAIKQKEPGLPVIVVDDGVDWNRFIELSANDCQDVINRAVTGEKPFVFARNVNIGMRAAGDADCIVTNDDALLQTPGGFTSMQWAAMNAPEYGVIAATSNNVGNLNQNKRAGESLRDEARTLCFICVLLTHKCREIVGELDERFVDYGLDDDDYSLRVRHAGLKLGIFDGCYVDHGSLTSSFRTGRGGDFSANMRRFIEKWGVDNWNRPRGTSQFAKLFPPEAQ